MASAYCHKCGSGLARGALFCSRCGAKVGARTIPPADTEVVRPSHPETTRLYLSAAASTAGGLLVLVGCYLPWSVLHFGVGQLPPISTSGMDTGDDGRIVAALGLVVVLASLSHLLSALRGQPLPGYRLLMVILGLLAVGAAFYEGSGSSGTSPFGTSSMGIGVIAIGLGGFLVVVAASFLGYADRPD